MYSRLELSKEKAVQESPFLKLFFSEILLTPMTGKQVTFLARNISTDFKVIASDSDLALDFSVLGFRAIIISLTTIKNDIF